MKPKYAILTLILALYGFTSIDELPVVKNVSKVAYSECLSTETATGSTVSQAIKLCK